MAKKNKATEPAPSQGRKGVDILMETTISALGAMKGLCPHDKDTKESGEVCSVKQCDKCIAEAVVYVAHNFIMNQLAYEIEQANFMQVQIDMAPDEAVDYYRAGLAQLLRGHQPNPDLNLQNINPTQIFQDDESEEK